MSYEPTQWNSGDIVTSAKLNKLEQGVANAGGGSGGSVLVVGATLDEQTGVATLNKTWQEINDAPLAVVKMLFEGEGIDMAYVSNISHNTLHGEHYAVSVFAINQGQVSTLIFEVDSADGYPSLTMS